MQPNTSPRTPSVNEMDIYSYENDAEQFRKRRDNCIERLMWAGPMSAQEKEMWAWKDVKGIQYVADLVLGVRSGKPEENEALQRQYETNKLRKMPSTDLLLYRWLPKNTIGRAAGRIYNTFNREHMRGEATWLSPKKPDVWRQHLTISDSDRFPWYATMVFAGLEGEGPRQMVSETPQLLLSHNCLLRATRPRRIRAMFASISKQRVATVLMLSNGMVVPCIRLIHRMVH
jgi:hypothetical protein